MCYYNSLAIEAKQLAKDLKIIQTVSFDSQLFIDGFKYGPHPVILKHDGKMEFCMMNWGFLPKEVKSRQHATAFRKTYTSLVAKCEKYNTSRFYKEAFLERHCLIPSTGFFEKRYYRPKGKIDDQLYPYYISPTNGKYFLIAGIFQEATFKDSDTKQLTVAVVTRGANRTMDQIHNNPKNPGRMPLILDKEMSQAWMNNSGRVDINDIFAFKYPSDQMHAWTVSRNFKTSQDPTAPIQHKELPDLV